MYVASLQQADRLMLYQTIPTLNDKRKTGFRKHLAIGENADWPYLPVYLKI